MFRGIGNWLRAWSSWFNGVFTRKAKRISMTPEAIEDLRDRSIEGNVKQAEEVIQLLKEVEAQRQMKREEFMALKQKEAKYNAMVEYAQKAAVKRADALRKQGVTEVDKIEADAEYQKFFGGWKDHSSTLKQVLADIPLRETELNALDGKYSKYKGLREKLLAEIQDIREKATRAKAAVISNAMMKRLDAVERGLSITGAGRERTMLEEITREAEAESRVRADTAVTEKDKVAAEFEAYAEDALAKEEFRKRTGIKEQETPPVDVEQEGKLRVDLPGGSDSSQV